MKCYVFTTCILFQIRFESSNNSSKISIKCFTLQWELAGNGFTLFIFSFIYVFIFLFFIFMFFFQTFNLWRFFLIFFQFSKCQTTTKRKNNEKRFLKDYIGKTRIPCVEQVKWNERTTQQLIANMNRMPVFK